MTSEFNCTLTSTPDNIGHPSLLYEPGRYTSYQATPSIRDARKMWAKVLIGNQARVLYKWILYALPQSEAVNLL